MDPEIILPIAGMITAIILGTPLMRAVARAIERKAGGGGGDIEALRHDIRELRDTIETSDYGERLLDLEERADFTERLLAQGKSPDSRKD